MQYRDLRGNTTQLSGGTVTIGIKPILLEDPNATQLAHPTNLRLVSP